MDQWLMSIFSADGQPLLKHLIVRLTRDRLPPMAGKD
ncbi:hypothetical protein FHR55_002559 [Xanthomonas arboricola]